MTSLLYFFVLVIKSNFRIAGISVFQVGIALHVLCRITVTGILRASCENLSVTEQDHNPGFLIASLGCLL